MSDRFGRRPVLLFALVLYGMATVACALAQSIDALIAARFVQALGGAGAIVLARAVVRDLYSGVRAGRELSLMGSITGLAPIVAPMIGGVLQTAFGWRSCFILLVTFRRRRRRGRDLAVAGDLAPAHARAILAPLDGRAL